MSERPHVRDVERDLKRGTLYPYDGKRPEQDWAHRAARGIAADLCDRRGIKWEMEKVDADVSEDEDQATRREIVDAHAAIIRAAWNSRAPSKAERDGVLEEAALACLNEQVDDEATGEETDIAYNQGCYDCARAIREMKGRP